MGLSNAESEHYINKAHSFFGQLLNKNVKISLLAFDLNISKYRRAEKIRKMFSENIIIKKMEELNFPENKIKEYLNNFYSGFFSFLNPSKKTFERNLNLMHELKEELNGDSMAAINKIEEELIKDGQIYFAEEINRHIYP